MAFSLDGRGGGASMDATNAAAAVDTGVPYWIHLNNNHPGAMEWLEKTSGLDSLIIEALTAEETRPRVTETGAGAVVILRGVNLNENADPEDMVSIRLYIDNNRVISICRRPLRTASDIHGHILKGTGPASTGEFLPLLIDLMCDRMEDTFSKLNDLTDEIEDQIIEEADSGMRRNIIDIRKKAIVFRRYLGPQKDALTKLYDSKLEFMQKKDRRLLHESHNRITRYLEDFNATCERTMAIQDELNSILSEKLNRNIYILSIIAAIFLPLSFLTGLLGINVGGIPGAVNNNAFWIFSGLVIGIIVLEIIIFKKIKWL